MLITVINAENVVEMVISANSIEDVRPYYSEEYMVVENNSGEDVGYKLEGGVFIPPKSTLFNQSAHITQLAFMSRFSDQEAIAIDLASQGTTEAAAMLRRMLKLIESATFVDLLDPRVQQGVQALEYVYGVLPPGRANEILNSPVLDTEVYIP